MGREISYDFIFEAGLEFLEDPTLGVSHIKEDLHSQSSITIQSKHLG